MFDMWTGKAITADPTETYVRLNIGGKSYCVRKELYTEERTLMHDIVESSHEERTKCPRGRPLERTIRDINQKRSFFAKVAQELRSTTTLELKIEDRTKKCDQKGQDRIHGEALGTESSMS
ncbi:hypothetical protein TELCIR_09424 [Teladorsagia circumcincta]|uniref:Uncharacterized protein n=1 Tax=Teladorsagia circumcincta TaxID=45464 RepID=A0A2G9UGB5_TELCI|nr:hypothetical protein TELCIR_09424 [Teladorsagia circumcincta]